MSAISSDRPVFPPSLKGQGGAASVNAARSLKEAQAAFFRPSSVSAPAPKETVEEAPVQEAPVQEAPAAPRILRPGSYLDIRV